MIPRREILRSIVASPIAGWFRAWGSTPERIGPGLDAARHYQEAFGGLARLTDADRALITDWKAVPIDGAVRGLLRRASPALSALRRGATVPECAWEEARSIESLGRGHLNVLNQRIGKIALLRARTLFEGGRGTEALEDVFAAAGLGRHIGRAGILIARIYQLSLENEAIGLLGASLDRLDRSTLDEIPARIERLPASCDWPETLRLEARFIMATVAAKVEAAPSPLTAESLVDAGLTAIEAEAVLEQTGGDRRRILAVVEGVGPFLAGLAEILALPFDASGDALPPIDRVEAGEINPFGHSAAESIGWLRYAVERTRVLWLMLLAARSRIVEGNDAFRAIPDPFGDGPFAIREWARGFELRSALDVQGKLPAILKVGTPLGTDR